MSDMRKLLESMNKFAGEPEQKPGDQVRGTEKATKRKDGKHPFAGRLVGAAESKNMLADLEKELTENAGKHSLAEEFAQYKKQLDEFAPDEGGGSRKFIPWPEFIEQVKQIVGKDFGVKEKIIKSTIQDRFIPHDPMEFGPTMLYSYYEARAGRGKGAVSTRGSIQIGKYFGNSDYFKSNNPELANQLLTSFSLLKGHPFERHFDLTFDNIYKIANIIQGNTQGAYQMPQQQGISEAPRKPRKPRKPAAPQFTKYTNYELWERERYARGANYSETEIDGRLVGVAVVGTTYNEWGYVRDTGKVVGMWYNKAGIGSFVQDGTSFDDSLSYAEQDTTWPYMNESQGVAESQVTEAPTAPLAPQVAKVLKGLGYKFDSKESYPGRTKSWWTPTQSHPSITDLVKALSTIDPTVKLVPNWQYSDRQEQLANAKELRGNLFSANFLSRQDGGHLFVEIYKKTASGKLARQDRNQGLDPDARLGEGQQGVAESTGGKLPGFLSYVLSNSQGQFSDIEQIEDLFDYAYLSDLDLETIADGANEEGVSAIKWATPRMAWLLKHISDKSKLAVIKPLAASWLKTVAPAIDQYVKDVLSEQGVAEMDGDGAGRDGSNRKRMSSYGTRDRDDLSNGPDVHLGSDSMMASKDMQDRALDTLTKMLSKPENMNVLKRLKTKEGVAEGEEEALQYATQAHAGQTRAGGDPYITHPMRVADHIRQYKQSHNLEALISAAYLHDTIEDTDTTHEILHDLFGGLVASLVQELTSDPEQIKQMGKAQYLAHKMAAMSSYGLVIKLADRLDNVKDITTARTPQWRAKYKAETEHILNFIEKNRVLTGTHRKLIGLIRNKIGELVEPQVQENYSDEAQPIQNDTAVEAYGYAYNKRDQRVMWRKEFSSQEAAYKWADSKNATVIGIRPAAQAMEEGTNPTDTVTMDIPLMIRLFEYAREDAQTDMDLHNVAERLIKLSAGGQTLTMDNYNDICPGQETVDEDVPAPVATAGGVAGATQPSTQAPAPGAAPNPAQAAQAKQNQAKLQQNLANLKTAGVQIDPAKAAQTLQKTDTGAPMNAMDKDTIAKMAPAIGNVMSNPSTATQLNTLIKKAGGGV